MRGKQDPKKRKEAEALFADDVPTPQVARQLGIAPSTVRGWFMKWLQTPERHVAERYKRARLVVHARNLIEVLLLKLHKAAMDDKIKPERIASSLRDVTQVLAFFEQLDMPDVQRVVPIESLTDEGLQELGTGAPYAAVVMKELNQLVRTLERHGRNGELSELLGDLRPIAEKLRAREAERRARKKKSGPLTRASWGRGQSQVT